MDPLFEIIEQGVLVEADAALIHADLDRGKLSNYFIRLAANQDAKPEMFDLLIKHGADIHAADEKAVSIAAQYDNYKLLPYLVERGQDINAERGMAIIEASKRNDIDLIRFLEALGADIRVRGYFPVIVAITSQSMDVARHYFSQIEGEELSFNLKNLLLNEVEFHRLEFEDLAKLVPFNELKETVFEAEGNPCMPDMIPKP